MFCCHVCGLFYFKNDLPYQGYTAMFGFGVTAMDASMMLFQQFPFFVMMEVKIYELYLPYNMISSGHVQGGNKVTSTKGTYRILGSATALNVGHQLSLEDDLLVKDTFHLCQHIKPWFPVGMSSRCKHAHPNSGCITGKSGFTGTLQVKALVKCSYSWWWSKQLRHLLFVPIAESNLNPSPSCFQLKGGI